MQDWFISQQDNYIWLSGSFMNTKKEVLDKVRKLKPGVLNLSNDSYDVDVVDTKIRSYYLIKYDGLIGSDVDTEGKQLKKWAETQTNKHDAFYENPEINELNELDEHISKHNRKCHRAGPLVSAGVGLIATIIVNIIASMIFVGFGIFVPISIELIATVMEIAGFGCIAYGLLHDFGHVKLWHEYIFTKTDVIIDIWGFKNKKTREQVKRLMTKLLSKRGKLTVKKETSILLRMIVSEPHPSIEITTDTAIDVMKLDVNEAFNVQHYKNKPGTDETIESKGIRIVSAGSSSVSNPHLKELESLCESINELESKTMADNKISKLVKDKIDSINSSSLVQANTDYKSLIKELEQVRNSLERIKNDNEGIQDSLNDLNDMALLKSKL